MLRKMLVTLLCFFSAVSVASAADVVPQALSGTQNPSWCSKNASISSAPDFCKTFPPAIECNCNSQKGSTPQMCSDPSLVYKAMMDRYHTLAAACAYPTPNNVTSQKECEDDWNCYWDGGTSSTGKCNANGVACTTKKRPV